MTIPTIAAYGLIATYFVLERLLRKGAPALSLNPGEADGGSSQVMWATGLLSLLLMMAAPILSRDDIGVWNSFAVGWCGLALMLGGLALRVWAARTLGTFYTRTLQVVGEQRIVSQAPYNVVRHPGYLGTFLLEIGAGLAVTNWIVLLAVGILGIISRIYRIHREEKMLAVNFGQEYNVYTSKTWRLLPFLY
jgi:protein-S-isoprenylcysteine O-methyltransferase Ste14